MMHDENSDKAEDPFDNRPTIAQLKAKMELSESTALANDPDFRSDFKSEIRTTTD